MKGEEEKNTRKAAIIRRLETAEKRNSEKPEKTKSERVSERKKKEIKNQRTRKSVSAPTVALDLW